MYDYEYEINSTFKQPDGLVDLQIRQIVYERGERLTHNFKSIIGIKEKSYFDAEELRQMWAGVYQRYVSFDKLLNITGLFMDDENQSYSHAKVIAEFEKSRKKDKLIQIEKDTKGRSFVVINNKMFYPYVMQPLRL